MPVYTCKDEKMKNNKMTVRRRRVSSREKVYYWWSVYRVLLKTAKLREELSLERGWKQTLQIYERWGDVTATNYEVWWKSHRTLFLDEIPAVRVLETSQFRRQPDCLYLECDLKRPPTSLLPIIRHYLRKKLAELNRTGKVKTKVKTVFECTPGREIRRVVYQDYVLFLKEIYAPNCVDVRPMNLRRIARSKYCNCEKKGKEEKDWEWTYKKSQRLVSLRLERSDMNTKEPIVYISMNRYINKVKELCRNVAKGEFPGKRSSAGAKKVSHCEI